VLVLFRLAHVVRRMAHRVRRAAVRVSEGRAMTERTTAEALRVATELLPELKRLHEAGALFETDLEAAVETARGIREKMPDDTGDRLVRVLVAWLHEFRRDQVFRPGAADAFEAARRAVDDAAGGKGGAR
jgi:hypothetical protein